MRDSRIYVKIFINFILAVLILLSVLYLLPMLIKFFMPFVIGWIVAVIANPLVHFLEKKVKILRKHSSAIIIVVVIAVIVGAAYLLIMVIIKESNELINELPDIVDKVGIQFKKVSQNLQILSASLPSYIQTMINDFIVGVQDYIPKLVDRMKQNTDTFSTLGDFAKNIAKVFLDVIITILSAYFFIAERDIIVNGLNKNLPDSVTNGWHFIYDNFKTAVGGYFKAQFKIMLVLTVVMFVGFEVLKINYSFVIALGIAFLDLLPVFGTGVVLWPWALIDMMMGNYFRAIGLVTIYLACQIIKQILQPKMVGDSIGISPLATLIFMFIGYRFYGVIGMILGVPFGMVLVNLYRIGMFERIIRGFKIIIHDINEFRKY